jgi:hypothetical protein
MSDTLTKQLNRVREATKFMRERETPSDDYPVRMALENLILAIEILDAERRMK